MHRLVLALALGTALTLAGCATGGPGATPTDGSPTPSAASSPTVSGSDGAPTATGEPVEVDYRVRPGSIPDEFASLNVTVRVVFVDKPDDLGPCYQDVFVGPYKPTITPLPTPAGECHSSEPITLDLTELAGERSLGTFTAPGSTSGHALIVSDVDAKYENGTAVSTIYGMGGGELVRMPVRPLGPYGVTVGADPAPDGRDYDYWFVHERYDVSE